MTFVYLGWLHNRTNERLSLRMNQSSSFPSLAPASFKLLDVVIYKFLIDVMMAVFRVPQQCEEVAPGKRTSFTNKPQPC